VHVSGEQDDIRNAPSISNIGDAVIADQQQMKSIQSVTEALSDALIIPQVAEVVIRQVLAVSAANAIADKK
jgi:hypothetical protein